MDWTRQHIDKNGAITYTAGTATWPTKTQTAGGADLQKVNERLGHASITTRREIPAYPA